MAARESVTAWTSALGGGLLNRLFLFLITLVALFWNFRNGASLANRVFVTADLLFWKSRRATGEQDGRCHAWDRERDRGGCGRGRRHHRHRICLAGVPHPLLFAVLTIAFAILPCGAWFTLSAAALVRLLHSGSLSAAGLFSFSGAVTLVGDNFIQPALTGGTARLPFLLALMGILGGFRRDIDCRQ
jgi:hypothetical protein